MIDITEWAMDQLPLIGVVLSIPGALLCIVVYDIVQRHWHHAEAGEEIDPP
jgi:hypothetical protein